MCPVKSGNFGEEPDAMSEPKSPVDAGSTGPFNAGKLIPALAASEVKLKTVNHYPIISIFAPGAARTDEGLLPATVDTLGSTEGVGEGTGSGYEPPCYAERRRSSPYAPDALGSEGCDFTDDPEKTNYEPLAPSEEPIPVF